MKKRYFIAGIFLLAAFFISTACLSQPGTAQKADVIDIFSFNDFHGTIDKSASGSNPGADRFTAIVKHLMSENPNSILVAAGDNYQGSPLSNLFHGEPVSKMIKYLGVKYSALGNHEFDWGQEYIRKFANDGALTFLGANVFIKGTEKQPDFCKAWDIVNIGGWKIGFIGLSTVETSSMTKAANVENLEFRQPGPWLSAIIKNLKKKQGCDLVIALTHMPVRQNSETKEISGEAAELAKTCPEFDAIITGHSHQLVAGDVNNVRIIQGNYNGRGLGRLNIKYEDNIVKITPSFYTQNNMNTGDILPNNPLEVNEDIKAMVAGYQEKSGPLFAEVVGKYGADISSRDAQADWATKLVFDYIKRVTGTEYILVQNAGGWRDTSPYNRKASDDVTLGYLYTLMPFDNEIVLLEMTGRDILYMLGSPSVALGSAAVVAGIRKDGNIWRLASTNEAIENSDKAYKIACNDFMLTGGDNFPFPGSSQGRAANVKKLVEPVFMGMPLRDAMVLELKHRSGISWVSGIYLFAFAAKSGVTGETK